MKIIINASLNYNGGGLQVALSFINTCKSFPDNIYHVFASKNVASQLEEKVFPSNFIFYHIPTLKFYEFSSYLSKLEGIIEPDVVFSIFGPVYWRPHVFHVVGFAQGHYIYDDSPFWKKVSIPNKLQWKLKKYIHLCYLRRDADVFIVETEDVALRLNKLLKKTCYVVPNTYSSYFGQYLFEKGECNQILPLKDKGEFRLLSVCTPYSHKNLEIIPSVVDSLIEEGYDNIRFIITASDIIYKKMIPEAYRKYVTTTGTISPQNVPQLYFECDAVFVPSLLECFTANFPEAMVMGKPILASDLSFSHSICGNAALFFDPLVPFDIADKIIKLLENPLLRNELVELGKRRLSIFKTSEERAKAFLDICFECAFKNE
jgi:hypothetical protein